MGINNLTDDNENGTHYVAFYVKNEECWCFELLCNYHQRRVVENLPKPIQCWVSSHPIQPIQDRN